MATRPKAAVRCGAPRPSCTAGYEQIATIDVMCVDSALVRGAEVDRHLDAVVGQHQVAQECLERARHGGVYPSNNDALGRGDDEEVNAEAKRDASISN